MKMHTLYRVGFSPLVAVLLLLTFHGCSDSGGKNPVSPGDSNGDWKVGTAVEYTVSGSSKVAVEDSVSGCTFIFPEGGDGTLSVAPVTAGPELAFDAVQFAVTFTGNETVEIMTPVEDGGYTALFGYGALENAAIDSRAGNVDWWGIPGEDSGDGHTVFTLQTSGKLLAKSFGVYADPDSKKFALANVAAGSGDAQKMAAVEKTVKQVVDYWLDNLPVGISTEARNQVNGDLKYTITWSNSGNAYQHSNSWIGSNAKFFLDKNVDFATIAHEVGHYMTHVLVGYARYEEIYNRFPTDFWGSGIQHGIGDYREGRKDLLEDYAYFSTYMLTGSLQGADLKKTYIRTFLGSKGPDSIDFPSQEGYGSVVLGALLREDSEVYTFDSGRGKTNAPVVNASLSDVLGILARGPRDVNELRQFIDDYLMARDTSYQYKLPAMLEPLGWSYNGMGSVVDQENKVVTDAYAVSISQDGTAEYRTTLSTVTGKDGQFYLPKIYPGANILRLFYNADRDSMDFPLAVEWNTVTHKTLELGTFTLKQEDIIIPLTLEGNYSLTPGIRAQNPLTLTCSGELTTSPGVFAYSYNTSNLLDIQSVAGLGNEMNLNLTIEYTLKNGTGWDTSLSQGDYADATKATTTLSNPRLKIIDVYGPSSDERKSETNQSPTLLNLTLDPPSEKGEYYRADIRLEWDYEQNYYDKDGESVGSTSGTTGVYIVHIWRDVSYF